MVDVDEGVTDNAPKADSAPKTAVPKKNSTSPVNAQPADPAVKQAPVATVAAATVTAPAKSAASTVPASTGTSAKASDGIAATEEAKTVQVAKVTEVAKVADVTPVKTLTSAPAATMAAVSAPAPAPAPNPFSAWLSTLAAQFQAMFANATPALSYKPGDNITQSNGTVVGKVTGYDAEGDPLIYTASKPTSGKVTIDTAGNFTYTPDPTATATTDQFTVTVAEANAATHFHGLMGLFTPGYGSTASLSVTVNLPVKPPTTTPPPSTTTPSPQMSTVPTSGDTTAALQAIFDKLKPGDTLTLGSRTYQHSGVLQIRVKGVTIQGNGATLQATNDATSSVQILADNVTLSNLTLSAPLQGPRYYALEQHKLVISGSGDTVTNVSINGSAGAGVFVNGASYFTLNQVRVSNTRADGIHITNGANNGVVNNPVITAVGDDGVAVVSYTGDPGGMVHDIIVNSPVVNGTTGGRGLSVVGGQNISYRNINVSNTNAAGVYIANEGSPYYTRSVNHVDVTGGTITGANYNGDVVHGAVMIYSGSVGQSINDVTISGLTVTSTSQTAQRNVAIVVDAGSVSNVNITNIALKNTTLTPMIHTSNVSTSSYHTSGWTLDGKPITV